MNLKHKDEWPQLAEIARKNNLDNEQIIILLALREIIDGITGFEFRRLEAKERSLEAQADLMAKEIKYKEFFYMAYLKRIDPNGGYTKDFIEYFGENEAYRLKRYIDLITQEFSFKEAT